MSEHILQENPDTTYNGLSYQDDEAGTFILYKDFVVWGWNKDANDDEIVHPSLSAAMDNSIGDEERYKNILSRYGKIHYKGDFEKTYKATRLNRDREEIVRGRIWSRSRTIAFWGIDDKVIENSKHIYKFLKTLMNVDSPEKLIWDYNKFNLVVNGKKKPHGDATFGDALLLSKGNDDNIETDEEKARREMWMKYHTETDTARKRMLAQKLGMIKPAPLKFGGMSQWQADQARGIAESKFKSLVNEMYGIEDKKESLSARLVRESISNETPAVEKDFKKYMTDRNLV